jgi:hypothetical protein
VNVSIGADFSDAERFHTKLRRFLPRWRRYHEAKIQDLIEQLYDDVRRAASGRPGPDVRSGAYLGSIVKTETKVFTSSPYGPRLEYGFTGTDRLGRNYHQPPFPHWRPAAAMLRKQFPRQIKRSVIEVWRSS